MSGARTGKEPHRHHDGEQEALALLLKSCRRTGACPVNQAGGRERSERAGPFTPFAVAAVSRDRKEGSGEQIG